MSRRIGGEGSIYKTQKGIWKASLSVGRLGGRRKRICRNAISRADAVAKLDLLRVEFKAGRTQGASRQSVNDFLENWIEQHVKAHRSPATYELWKSSVNNHVLPRFVGITLNQLSPSQIQSFVDELIRDKVGSRARQVAFGVLRKAIRHAKKLKLINDDPSAEVDKPAHDPKEIKPFSKEEADALIEETASTRWHALIVLTLTCGFRQGELWGLQWENVDLKRKRIQVVQAASLVGARVTIRKPKTKKGRRGVDLTDTAIEALKAHRAILMREGNAGNPLVFPAPKGGMMSRTVFRHRYWVPLLKRVGLDLRGFHHLRHTYAGLSLAAGVPINVVAQVMGHSKPSTTLDCYGHLLPNQQAAATEAMERLFGAFGNSIGHRTSSDAG